MANPVFNQTQAFQPGTPVGFDLDRDQTGAVPGLGVDTADRMSYEGTIVKAASLMLLGTAAAVGVGLFMPALAMPLAIVAFVLSLVTMFAGLKKPRPALYAVTIAFYGGAVGGISALYEASYGGIILQALVATAAVFTVSLVVYRSGRVRNMGKINKFLMIAVPAYVIFSLVNVGLTWFAGVNVREVEIAGIGMPLGVIISAIAIFIGALMLISDFDSVANGVRNGLPAQWEWAAAYGLVFSIIWIYLEIIRLLGYLRR